MDESERDGGLWLLFSRIEWEYENRKGQILSNAKVKQGEFDSSAAENRNLELFFFQQKNLIFEKKFLFCLS